MSNFVELNNTLINVEDISSVYIDDTKYNEYGATLYFVAIDMISSGKSIPVSFETYDKSDLTKKLKEIHAMIKAYRDNNQVIFSDVKISELIERLKGFQDETNNVSISDLKLEINGFDSNGENRVLTIYI